MGIMGTKQATGKAGRASSSFILLLSALALGLVLVGCSGDDGSTGPAGPSGPAGAAGAMGPSGAAGDSGAAGARGPAGPAGAAGADGADGAAGVAGVAGAAGPVGSGTVSPGSTLIAGKAIKGPIANASVFLLAFRANQITAAGAVPANCAAVSPALTTSTLSTAAGTAQELCVVGSSGTTDANGTFSLTVPSAQTTLAGPAVVQVTNGTMVDEATGATVTGPLGVGINTTLRALVAVDYFDDLRQPGGGGTIIPVAVTALTEMATSRAMGGGTAPSTGEAHGANTYLAALFGLTGISITGTIPSDILDANSSSDTDAQKTYGIINAGISQLAQVLEGDNDTLDVVASGALDFDDGIFNSIDIGGTTVTVPGATTTMPGSAFGATYSAAIATLQSGAANQTGFTVDAATLATISGAPIASNNILALSDNGCRAADNQLPSGPFMAVRTIAGGIATLRNSNSDRIAGGTAEVGLAPTGAGTEPADFLSGQSVNIRCPFANFSQGSTAADDRGSGTITVSPRFTIRDPLVKDEGTGALGGLVPVGGSVTTFRSISGTLSGLTVKNGPTGVSLSKPEGATITITGMRDANNNPIILSTPLSTSAIAAGGNLIRFIPGALIGAISGAGVSQFDGLIRNGVFVYEVSLGMNTYLHAAAAGAGSAPENNGPAAPRSTTCIGTPGTAGTAPASILTTAPSGAVGALAAGACVPITTIVGSLRIKQ